MYLEENNMLNCDNFNLVDYFIDETTDENKKKIIDHITACSDCENLFLEYKELFNQLNNAQIELPNKADDNYFSNLNNKISDKINLICSDVEELLVDYIEGTLNKPNNFDKKILVENHLELCKSCTQEYFLTKKVTELNYKEQKNTEEYFNKLADKITDKIFSKVDNICEKAQEYIPHTYTGEEIPKAHKNHLSTCQTCQTELLETDSLLNNIKTLEVAIPDNSYFDALSYRIEKAVELLPSYKNSEKTSFKTSLSNFINFILKPQIAVTSTAVISLLVFATLTFYDHKEATTPYNFSRIDDKKVENIKDDDFKIKDIKTNIDTAASKNLFFKEKELSSPQKDASLDQNLIETAAKKK